MVLFGCGGGGAGVVSSRKSGAASGSEGGRVFRRLVQQDMALGFEM